MCLTLTLKVAAELHFEEFFSGPFARKESLLLSLLEQSKNTCLLQSQTQTQVLLIFRVKTIFPALCRR